jgi:hypothetical protein
MIREREWGTNCILVAMFTVENSNWERLTAKEFTSGLTEKCMMVSGTQGLNKDMAFGKELQVIHLLESGSIQKLMGTECIRGRTEIDMKESGRGS